MAVWDYARWSGDVLGSARAAAHADPGCVLAHCVLALQLLAHGGAAAAHPEVLAAMRANRRLLTHACPGAEREEVHAAAIEAWADPVGKGGPRRAAAIWEAWLLKAPRDLLALRGSHDAHLALGDGHGALESIARVRPLWDSSVFGYGQVLSMHAMALTESSALSYAVASEAEDLANAARGTDKKDAWALHALVHVLDQGGRASEGQSLLRRERDFWEALPHLGAAVHFGAHLARFYMERGNYKAALRTADTAVLEAIHSVGARAQLGLAPDSDPNYDFDAQHKGYLQLADGTKDAIARIGDGSATDHRRAETGEQSKKSPQEEAEEAAEASSASGGGEHGDDDYGAGSNGSDLGSDSFVDDGLVMERLRFPPPSALVDATSVLWRLELNGIAASFRWLKLADHWECVSPGMGLVGVHSSDGRDGDGDQELEGSSSSSASSSSSFYSHAYSEHHRQAALWAYGEDAASAVEAAAARQRAALHRFRERTASSTAPPEGADGAPPLFARDDDLEKRQGGAAASATAPRELIHSLTPLMAVHRTMCAVACAELLQRTAGDDDDDDDESIGHADGEGFGEGGGALRSGGVKGQSGGGNGRGRRASSYGSLLDDMVAPTPSLFSSLKSLFFSPKVVAASSEGPKNSLPPREEPDELRQISSSPLGSQPGSAPASAVATAPEEGSSSSDGGVISAAVPNNNSLEAKALGTDFVVSSKYRAQRAMEFEAAEADAAAFDYTPDLEARRMQRILEAEDRRRAKQEEDSAGNQMKTQLAPRDDEDISGSDSSGSALAPLAASSSDEAPLVPLDESYFPAAVLFGNRDFDRDFDDTDEHDSDAGFEPRSKSASAVERLFLDDPSTSRPPLAPAAAFCANPVTGLRAWELRRERSGKEGGETEEEAGGAMHRGSLRRTRDGGRAGSTSGAGAPSELFVRRQRLRVPSLETVSRATAQEAAAGVVAYWQRDLQAAMAALLPLKPQLHLLGGSVLDRETILLTLLEAAVRYSPAAYGGVRSDVSGNSAALLPSPAGGASTEDYDQTHEQSFRGFMATVSPGAEEDLGSDPRSRSIGIRPFVPPESPLQAQIAAGSASQMPPPPSPPSSVVEEDRGTLAAAESLALARALMAERTALKTGSAQAWVRYAIVLERLGDHISADMARRTAHALGIGQGGAGAH